MVVCFYVAKYIKKKFFFYIDPQPPRSTLFPYTTLFRSVTRKQVLDIVKLKMKDLNATNEEAAFRIVDRKSTRLNSSHQIISYAVFCLNKKKPLKAIRYMYIVFYVDKYVNKMSDIVIASK